MKIKFLAAASCLIFLMGSLVAKAGDGKPSNSAPVVSGVVVDGSSGEILAGVLVKLGENGPAVYTDFDGHFEFNASPSKQVDLSLSMVSYKKAEYNGVSLEKSGKKPNVFKIWPK